MTSISEREQIVTVVATAVASGARQSRACNAISMSERTLQRWQRAHAAGHGDLRPVRIQNPSNRLSELERKRILSVANSAEFGHLSPNQIVPLLADQGQYIGSESSFYRVMRAAKQVAHRAASKPASSRRKPRALSATAPNQIYSWDITYLPTEIRGKYFYLYLFIDLFSRKIVGWQIYDSESSERASEVIQDICRREEIPANQVVLHSDNGGPMKGATMLATLQQLGVAPSFSRPAVSNDNPFSESLFKTLKYHRHYPKKPFKDLQQARQWMTEFVRWYNDEHRHSAIKFITPSQRHEKLDVTLLRNRDHLYKIAQRLRPDRWSGVSRNWQPVSVVHLNPDKPLQPPVISKQEKKYHLKLAA